MINLDYYYEDKSRKLDRDYQRKLAKAKIRNKRLEYKNELRKIHKSRRKNSSIISSIYNKLGFTKILVIYVELNALLVQIWSMYEMHINQDLSALPYLIGATVTEAIGLLIFFVKKSTAENTKGGIVYDLAMKGEELKSINPFSSNEVLDIGKDKDK